MLVEYLISLVLFPFISIFVLIFFLYRCLITIILFLTVEELHSVLSGKDARMALAGISKSIPNILFLIDFGTNNSEKVYDELLRNLNEIFSSAQYPKIRCTLNKKFGYFYLTRNQLSIQEALSTFTDDTNLPIMPIENVRKFMDYINNRNMPKNNKALIQFIISEKPVEFENKNTVYALVVRFQHCLTDGPGFLHFILHATSRGSSKTFFSQRNSGTNTSIMKTILNGFLNIYYLAFGSFSTMKSALLRPEEKNLFHKGELSGSKIAQWIIEDYPENLVHKIQDVRKEFRVTFTDVILTCIAASLKQFANKKVEILDSITNVDTMITQRINLKEIPLMINTFGTNVLNYSLTSLNQNKNHLIPLLQEINTINAISKSSISLQATDVFIKVFGTVLPEPLMQKCLTGKNMTFALSNMSRIDKFAFFGNDVKATIALPPNDGHVGLSFVVKSYKNKLLCCLLADKNCVCDVKEVEEILQGVIQNIHQLHNEGCCENTKL